MRCLEKGLRRPARRGSTSERVALAHSESMHDGSAEMLHASTGAKDSIERLIVKSKLEA